MRKTLIIGIVAFLSLILAYGFGYATITGIECVKCHTMHSSQTPSPTDWLDKGWTPGALNGALVVGGCVGCHSSIGSDSTVDDGHRPIVWNQAMPIAPLAGGNFYYRAGNTANDNKVHNVVDIATGVDSILNDFTPPGWMMITGIGPNEDTWSQQLRCAGAYGCHGNRATAVTDQFAAVRGSHHESNTTIDGSTVGKSYRFLYVVVGKEDNDWEEEVAIDHNVYKGDVADNPATISYLCAGCHGKFHTWVGGTQVGTESPWLRHPTDIALGASGGSLFETDYGDATHPYNVETPVGFEDPDSQTVPITTFTASNARVICLSCHRAHGTNEPDILRFTYNIQAGTGGTTGCLRCHERQR